MAALKIFECDFTNPFHCETLADLMNAYITDRMGGGLPYSSEQRRQLIDGLKNHPSRLVLFVALGDKIIGLTTCFINFATFSLKSFMNIHDVIVLQEFRGTGAGRKLMEGVIEHAQKIGCSKITLEVREDNIPAQNLYKSLDFRECEPVHYFWTKYL
ncbi:MAG: GNAT family N-acetyltransferase [Bacteroidales bacterium]|nr:GNAT family N-acetyltransferase [Bacteroidales bacterium]